MIPSEQRHEPQQLTDRIDHGLHKKPLYSRSLVCFLSNSNGLLRHGSQSENMACLMATVVIDSGSIYTPVSIYGLQFWITWKSIRSVLLPSKMTTECGFHETLA